MRLAILGGTFNPVHCGHIALARDVHESLAYDLVLLIPANLPPHKELAGGSTSVDRLAMLNLACGEFSFVRIEDCELMRGGKSYTIDTIEYLEKKYADLLEGKIGLVIGEDLVAGFTSWKDSSKLLGKVDIIIARRPGNALLHVPFHFTPLLNPLLEISSTEIRENCALRKSCRSLVPEQVYRYIKEHKLYENR